MSVIPSSLLRRSLSLRSFSISARMTSSATPMEDAIREKVTKSLSPSYLFIRNDSRAHADHEPMRGSTSTETHFHVSITSTAFQSKMQSARHRMVYSLLQEELSREGGIHALQLQTRTPEEEARDLAKEKEKEKAKAKAAAQ